MKRKMMNVTSINEFVNVARRYVVTKEKEAINALQTLNTALHETHTPFSLFYEPTFTLHKVCRDRVGDKTVYDVVVFAQVNERVGIGLTNSASKEVAEKTVEIIKGWGDTELVGLIVCIVLLCEGGRLVLVFRVGGLDAIAGFSSVASLNDTNAPYMTCNPDFVETIAKVLDEVKEKALSVAKQIENSALLRISAANESIERWRAYVAAANL